MYVESFSGNESITQHFIRPMTAFGIINDAETDLTFTINQETFTVLVGEQFYKSFPAFYAVQINSSGAWRAFAEGADLTSPTLVSDLFLELRYELNDLNKTKVSDYALLVALNNAIKLINNFLMKFQNSRLNATQVTINLSNGEAALPSDFMKLISVKSEGTPLEATEFYILGNRLYAPDYESVVMIYNYMLSKVTGINDILPLPPYFDEYIKKYIKLIITGNQDILPQISNDITQFINSRESVGLELSVPFNV